MEIFHVFNWNSNFNIEPLQVSRMNLQILDAKNVHVAMPTIDCATLKILMIHVFVDWWTVPTEFFQYKFSVPFTLRVMSHGHL